MWLAADEFGEYLFAENKPKREDNIWVSDDEMDSVKLEEGEIYRLLGRNLNIKDEPVPIW